MQHVSAKWTNQHSLDGDGKIILNADAWLAYSEAACMYATAILKGALQRLRAMCCKGELKRALLHQQAFCVKFSEGAVALHHSTATLSAS